MRDFIQHETRRERAKPVNGMLRWGAGYDLVAAFPGDAWFGKMEREPGDIGYDPIRFFKNKTPAQKEKLQLQELKNGRLAMMAMAAYTSEHWLPGSVPFIPGHF